MMRSKTKILLVCLLLGLTFAGFASAALVNCGGYGESGTQSPCTLVDLLATIRLIINTLLSWAWLVSIVFIVWSGFQMVFSRGNEEQVSKAKTSLSNAIIGFIIILISFVLLNFVVALLTGEGGFSSSALIDSFDLVP